MATGEQLLTITPSAPPQHQDLLHSSTPRRKHKKCRYIKHGFQKSERENAKRNEARAFLSGITLDSNLRTPLEVYDMDSNSNVTSTVISASTRLSSSIQAPEDSSSLQYFEKLHEMAANLFEVDPRQSPVKLTPSIEPQSNPIAVTRSAYCIEAVSTPNYDPRRHTVQPISHSKSVGYTGDSGEIHYFGNFRKWVSNNNARIVLTTSGAPFLIFSTLAYKKNEKFNLEHPQRQRVRTNSTSLQLDVDVNLGTDNEVSLAHLLNPVYQLQSQSESLFKFHSGIGWQSDIPQSKLYKLSAHYNEVLDHPLPSSSGRSFPWAGFRDHHTTQDVLIHYHPLCIDNYEFFVGPNISTLSLLSYRVSIIQYAKASEIKKGINDQFSDIFPHIKITLSKLRSIKREMYNIAREKGVNLATVSYAYVYFEKLILMGKVNKSNRKVIAGICLLLAAKFFTDMKKPEVKELLDEISNTFRVNAEELVSHELTILAALHFSLLTPIGQVWTHYEKLRDRDKD